MAEIWSSCSGSAISAQFIKGINKSPISYIPQDHLFSILLLLPIDSIVSFAMSCRRFKSLACSDTLWKSLCRRDWGDASVDVFQSSHHGQLPWIRLYQQVSQLETVCCHQLVTSDSGMQIPRPRASHSLNCVSDCLVLYGGGSEGGRHLDDTWVAYIGNDFPKALKWRICSSGIPKGRFGHTCVVINKSLILFGGMNDRGIRQNDTWVGRIHPRDHTLSWALLEVGPVAPLPRGAHAGCSLDNDDNVRKMVIHGGIGSNGLRLSDTWLLEISENLGIGFWHEIRFHPYPSPRSGHTMTCVGKSKTVLFGGRGVGYDVLDDVWVLDLSNGSLKWAEMVHDSRVTGLARVGHSAALVLGGRVLIHGGEDSNRRRKDDFWLLDVGKRKVWKRMGWKGVGLSCRSFHRGCADDSGIYVYVFGGMMDEGANLGPSLRFDGGFFMVELVL